MSKSKTPEVLGSLSISILRLHQILRASSLYFISSLFLPCGASNCYQSIVGRNWAFHDWWQVNCFIPVRDSHDDSDESVSGKAQRAYPSARVALENPPTLVSPALIGGRLPREPEFEIRGDWTAFAALNGSIWNTSEAREKECVGIFHKMKNIYSHFLELLTPI